MVFLNLKIAYELEFEYDENDVKDITINEAFGKLPLPEAMGRLLQGTGLSFELVPPSQSKN